jgi:ABC-2 type transport system permease protein
VKLIDIAWKDMLRSFRSLFAIGMMIAAPLLITGLIYMAFGGAASGKTDLPVTKVAIVNQDVPPAGSPSFGQSIIDLRKDAKVASWLILTEVKDPATAEAMVNNQEVNIAIIIPPDFSKSILTRQGTPQVRLIQDPTLTVGPMVIKNMVGSLLDGAAGAQIAINTELTRSQALGTTIDPASHMMMAQQYGNWFVTFQRTLYHSPQAALAAKAPTAAEKPSTDQQDGFKRILSLVLAGQMIFFGFYTGAFSMMSILQEQEEGTLARLFTTPTSRTVILGGKFLSVVFMVLVQGIVMVLVGIFVFGVKWGNPISVAISLIGQTLGATGLGVLIISFVKNTKQAGTVLGGGLSALGILGGLFTLTVPNAPKFFELSALFTPHGWVLRCWKATLAGGGPAEILLPLLVVTLMSAVMFGIGALVFQRRFAS